jgi:hypothetical protein
MPMLVAQPEIADAFTKFALGHADWKLRETIADLQKLMFANEVAHVGPTSSALRLELRE